MKAFLNHVRIQLTLDFRNKGTLLTFYIIPLLFYLVIGAVFASVQPQTKETLACMMRKDDPQFKRVVDRTIAALQTSGQAEKMYNKWFMSPIPPDGVNLNLPMSAEMKALFAKPNDQAD